MSSVACGSSIPLGVLWLLHDSAIFVLDCALFLVFGVKVATFIWTCLSTRAGWLLMPLFPRWHLTCRGVVQITARSLQLQFFPHRRRFLCRGAEASPLFAIPQLLHIWWSMSLLYFFYFPVVAQRLFYMVQPVCGPSRFPSCSSTL